jgi:hypothetical protein
MTYAARSLPPEPEDDDAPRVARAVRGAQLGKLEALAMASIPAGSRDRKDVLDLRAKLERDREPLTQKEQDRIAALMWKYRRQLPRGIAPKLNPADPVVRENAAKENAHVG